MLCVLLDTKASFDFMFQNEGTCTRRNLLDDLFSWWCAANHIKGFRLCRRVECDLLKFVHVLFFFKGLSGGFGKANAGYNPAHHSLFMVVL
jgi:hypothetical protein